MYIPSELLVGFVAQLCSRIDRFSIAFDHSSRSAIQGAEGHEESHRLIKIIEGAIRMEFQSGFDTLDEFVAHAPVRIVESAPMSEGLAKLTRNVPEKVLEEVTGHMSRAEGYRYGILRKD